MCCTQPGCRIITNVIKDGKYINNYIPTIILHVYFSNDITSLQKTDVTESEPDDCQLQSSGSQDCCEVWLLLTLSLGVNLMLVFYQTFSIINHDS